MKLLSRGFFFAAGSILALTGGRLIAANLQTNLPGSEYQIYAGSTHAHTAYTWSHGEQFVNTGR